MNIASSLHVGQDVVLQLRHRLQGVGYVLELLNVTDNLGCLCPFGKVDKAGLLDDGRDTILNKGEVRKVDTYKRKLAPNSLSRLYTKMALPKKGIQGGLPPCSASLYSPKFLVLAISLRMTSKVPWTRWGT